MAFTDIGEHGWHSGENAHLPPMWPEFKFWTWCHKWVEFVVGSHLALRVFLRVLQFSSLTKINISKFHFNRNSRATGLSVIRLLCVTLLKQS